MGGGPSSVQEAYRSEQECSEAQAEHSRASSVGSPNGVRERMARWLLQWRPSGDDNGVSVIEGLETVFDMQRQRSVGCDGAGPLGTDAKVVRAWQSGSVQAERLYCARQLEQRLRWRGEYDYAVGRMHFWQNRTFKRQF